jgi:hypothetical protein
MAREIAPFDAAQQVAFTSRTNWETERGPAATRKSGSTNRSSGSPPTVLKDSKLMKPFWLSWSGI